MEQMGCSIPYNFQIVFGFTDSTFFSNVPSDQKVIEFGSDCKEKLGVIVELKNVFTNSIFYGKKNRFAAWTGTRIGNEQNEPIIKGLDGLSDSNPLWIRRWFKQILIEIITHPDTRFVKIPDMLRTAFSELDNGEINTKEDLKFTQRLKYAPDEYEEHVRTGVLGKLLDKDRGDLVYWYETLQIVEQQHSTRGKNKKKSYSVKPENLNLAEYKNCLLKKLKDTLEIIGFNFLELKSELLEQTKPLLTSLPTS
jgi:hypothetical protein